MRYIEIRRHTENDGDRLTEQGRADVERIAGSGLTPPYAMFVSTGTWRAGEMATLLRKAVKQESLPLIDEPELRSRHERQWREAGKHVGDGATVEDVRAVDPDLVANDTWSLGLALRGVVARVPEGGRCLVVGHSPSIEAAVLGLTGQVISPLGFGEGVLIAEDEWSFGVSRLDAVAQLA